MRVGLVAQWFNRGQATVARYLRSALDGAGHETWVLARPTTARFVRPGYVATDDVWDQPGVTPASCATPPVEEYLAWAARHRLDVVLVDQNYQFDALAALRSSGIRVLGRFVWESVREEDVAAAADALDVVYSFTRAEQERYASFGLLSPLLPFGIHPELLGRAPERRKDGVDFFYAGGYLSKRKPTGAVLEAWRRAGVPGGRLLVKAQRPLRPTDLVLPSSHADVQRRERGEGARAAIPDPAEPGVVVLTDDLPTDAYQALFASCHVCVAVSRWEGLGLHLYEALAFGTPLLAVDAPPVNEVVEHEVNGLLVASTVLGHTRSGVESREPDIDELAGAFRRLARPEVLAELRPGVARSAAARPWEATVAALDALVRAA